MKSVSDGVCSTIRVRRVSFDARVSVLRHLLDKLNRAGLYCPTSYAIIIKFTTMNFDTITLLDTIFNNIIYTVLK